MREEREQFHQTTLKCAIAAGRTTPHSIIQKDAIALICKRKLSKMTVKPRRYIRSIFLLLNSQENSHHLADHQLGNYRGLSVQDARACSVRATSTHTTSRAIPSLLGIALAVRSTYTPIKPNDRCPPKTVSRERTRGQRLNA
jgi:hypothetical protein